MHKVHKQMLAPQDWHQTNCKHRWTFSLSHLPVNGRAWMFCDFLSHWKCISSFNLIQIFPILSSGGSDSLHHLLLQHDRAKPQISSRYIFLLLKAHEWAQMQPCMAAPTCVRAYWMRWRLCRYELKCQCSLRDHDKDFLINWYCTSTCISPGMSTCICSAIDGICTQNYITKSQTTKPSLATKGNPSYKYIHHTVHTQLGISTPQHFEINFVTSEMRENLRSPSPPDFLSV